MIRPWDILEFEWDAGNIDKSQIKHGVTTQETEEIFLDPQLAVAADIDHSKTEKRFIAVGKNLEDKYLYVVFTMRRNKIRVISARRMHREEVNDYEEIKKNS